MCEQSFLRIHSHIPQENNKILQKIALIFRDFCVLNAYQRRHSQLQQMLSICQMIWFQIICTPPAWEGIRCSFTKKYSAVEDRFHCLYFYPLKRIRHLSFHTYSRLKGKKRKTVHCKRVFVVTVLLDTEVNNFSATVIPGYCPGFVVSSILPHMVIKEYPATSIISINDFLFVIVGLSL